MRKSSYNMAHYKTVCPADKKALENIKLMFHPDGRRGALLFRAAAAVPEISRASVQKSAAIFARCAPVSSVRRGEPPEGGATRTLFFRCFCPSARATRAEFWGLRFSWKWGRDLFLCRGSWRCRVSRGTRCFFL